MGFRFGYLTPKQRKYWGLRRSGLTQADISREMDVKSLSTWEIKPFVNPALSASSS